MNLIFTVIFLDFLAFSAIIPFIPLLFLDTPHTLFAATTPLELRYILLGLLFSTYPLAQVLAAPILGHFSDRFGRKEILLLSYLGNAIGYLSCALAIYTSSISLLFLGNLIAGMTGANLSTINAIISDLSHNHKRSKYFGFSNLMLGLGFALGPALSIHFPNLFALFLICSGGALLNFLIIAFTFSHPQTKESLYTPFSLRQIFTLPKNLVLSYFLLIFGWYFFIKTFQVFLIEELHLSDIFVFNTISFYGFCSMLAQGAFVLLLHRFMRNYLHHTLFVLSLSIFLLTFTNTATLFPLVFLFSFTYALLIPSFTFLISEFSTAANHGKMMGLHTSISALAKILAPTIAGLFLALTPYTSVLLSSLCIFTSSLLFSFHKQLEKRASISYSP